MSALSSWLQERQRLQRCLQHSLNNLLQRPAFTSHDLDALANQLAPGRALQPIWHPHRTLLLGGWAAEWVGVLGMCLRGLFLTGGRQKLSSSKLCSAEPCEREGNQPQPAPLLLLPAAFLAVPAADTAAATTAEYRR